MPYDTTLTSAEVPDAAMYSLDNVTVVKCDHNGTSGFDMNSLKCPYCGAPAVAQTALTGVEGNPWRNFADLQTALDAQREGSSGRCFGRVYHQRRNMHGYRSERIFHQRYGVRHRRR